VETKAPRDTTGGPNVSRRSKDRFGGSPFRVRNFDLYCLAAWSVERGRFLPTAPMRSSL